MMGSSIVDNFIDDTNMGEIKEKQSMAVGPSGEPYLLTPGPLTTSKATKQAMLRDWGSWDDDFRAMTKKMRRRLLAIVEDYDGEFDCVPMQGSGTFVIEAMLGSLLARENKTLVLINGAYGRRIAKTLQVIGREHVILDKGDYLPPRGKEVAHMLANDGDISHVVIVHCETSSGILNPLEEISNVVEAAGCKLLIDAMSSFGAIDLSVQNIRYEAIVASANKCLEGTPGFGFVIARKSAIEAAEGNCHSLSLDLFDQWQVMNKSGQWRFTPPTHVVAAFLKALDQYDGEGGLEGRAQRYKNNRDVLIAGMAQLGFETLLDDDWLSPIIVTFFCPEDPKFNFDEFYNLMKQRDFIIYPGKLTIADSFRIGCIGQLNEKIMRQVVIAAQECLTLMGVQHAGPSPQVLEERTELKT